jgi:hypothetical protein
LGLEGEKHDPSDRRTGEGEGGEKRGWSVMRLTRCSVDISKVVGGCEVEVVFTGSKTETKGDERRRGWLDGAKSCDQAKAAAVAVPVAAPENVIEAGRYGYCTIGMYVLTCSGGGGRQGVKASKRGSWEGGGSRAVQGKSMRSDECKAQRHEAGRGKAATDVDEQAPVAKKDRTGLVGSGNNSLL